MNKLVVGLCTVVEMVCLGGLAGIALKQNNDCYKAQCKLIDSELNCLSTEIELAIKNAEIRKLKEELAELKSQKEEA